MTTARRSATSRAVGAALVVVSVLAIAGLVLVSPLFALSTFEIDGNVRLSDAQVRGLSGVDLGDNLVFVSSPEVEAALESSPWIAQAEAERRLPQTLLVSVTERRAVAWAADGDETYLVAGDGVVLAGTQRPPELPSVGTFASLEEGEPIPGPLEAVRVLAALSPQVRRAIEAAELDGDAVVLRFPDGSYVTFGPPTELRRKSAALEGILDWAEERGVAFRYVDVRVPESPVVRPERRPEVRPAVSPTP